MKTNIKHLAIFVLLTVLFTSCASNHPQCAAYAYATIENEDVEIDTRLYTLEPVASKGLEQQPQSFQWVESLTGPNGGRLY